MNESVAIIGIGCRFPGKVTGPEDLWELLAQEIDAVGDIPPDRLNLNGVDHLPTQSDEEKLQGGFLQNIDKFDAPFFGLTPREASVMDPQQRLLLETTYQALEDAGLSLTALAGSRTGVFMGIGGNEYEDRLFHHSDDVDFHTTIGGGRYATAGRLSHFFDLHGPSLTLDTAASSSLVAVHTALQSIRNGESTLAVAGGANIILLPKISRAYSRSGMLSARCRFGDASMEGFVRSEGIGVVVLKPLSAAQKDNDPVYAVIRGGAVNHDGRGGGLLVQPSPEGQKQMLADACRNAGTETHEIQYVECHGTGTRAGDPVEIHALNDVLGVHRKTPLLLGSIKTNIGHTEACAGVAGLIKVALCMRHNQIPASLHLTTPNPQIPWQQSPLKIPQTLTPWPSNGRPKIAGVSSFGITGTNAHIILESPPPVAKHASAPNELQLLTLSAQNPETLRTLTGAWIQFLSKGEFSDLYAVCNTAALRRSRLEYRLTCVGRNAAELQAGLKTHLDQTGTGVRTGHARPQTRRKTLFVFPGQGYQLAPIAKKFLETEKTFRDTMLECDQYLQQLAGHSIAAFLFENRLSEVVDQAVQQPLMCSIQIALFELWRSYGVTPDFTIGHSMGEVAAAYAAGVFDLKDTMSIIYFRGRATQKVSGQGRMLYANLTPENALRYIEGYEATVSIAAFNGPENIVISGTKQHLQEISTKLEANEIFSRLLHNIRLAGHSPLVDAVLPYFREALPDLSPRDAAVPYFSPVTGAEISGRQLTTDFWCRNMRQPAQFASALEHCLEQKPGVFIEIAPHPVLAPTIEQLTKNNQPTDIFQTLHQDEDPFTTFLNSLAGLHAIGHPINFNKIFPAPAACERLPHYPFRKKSYWFEKIPGSETDEEPETLPPFAAQTAGIDTNALMNLQTAAQTEHTIRFLQKLFANIMKLPMEQLTLEKPLITQGLDSLMAFEAGNLLQKQAGIHLPVLTFLKKTLPETAEIFLQKLREISGAVSKILNTADRIAVQPDPDNRFKPFPLTDIQQAYRIGRSGVVELGKVSIHGYFEVDCENLDLKRLTAAWQKVIARHEMLRVVLLADGQQQILEKTPPFEITVLDLRKKAPAETQTRLQTVHDELSHQVLPLDRWPLYETRATLLSPTTTRLHISIDFIMLDAWSANLLFRELIQFYRDSQFVPTTQLQLSFRDYVLGEQALRETQSYRKSLAYWRQRIAELPPAPKLPLKTTPKTLQNHYFRNRDAELDAKTWTRLKTRTRQAGLTLPGLLLAVYAEVLAAWSETAHFTINMPHFNRHALHPQVNDIIGNFSSFIPVEADRAQSESFEDRARRIQERIWEALEHRQVSGIQILREMFRTLGQVSGALMPVVFTDTPVQSDTRKKRISGLLRSELCDLGDVRYGIVQTPQVILDLRVAYESDTLHFSFDAVEALFPAGMLDDMFAAYKQLLTTLANDENSWRSPSFPLTPRAQLQQRDAVNATQTPMPEELLQTLFATQAQKTPQEIAVIADERRVTYDQLFRRANQLGRALCKLGARPNQPVGVVLPKGLNQILAVLGVLNSGAAYTPLDAAQPEERLQSILKNNQITLVVTDADLERSLQWPPDVRLLDVDCAAVAAEDDAPVKPAQQTGDLAYIIHTSGSTGSPSGVKIAHRGVVNAVLHTNRTFHVGPADRVLALTALHHDMSVYDIFGILTAGGAIVTLDSADHRNPARWAELLVREKITIWNSVPAMMEMLLEYLRGQSEFQSALRLAFLGGDWVGLSIPERLRAITPEARVVSVGGPTETTLWNIWYPIDSVDPAWKSVPYGKPIANTRYYILNEFFEDRPDWVPGEMCCAGVGVAQGYWLDEKKTKSKFIMHPQTGERLYRTGDAGRYLPDGNIEFLGRVDFQLNIRGHRIEPGEVEAALLRHPSVRAAAVTATGSAANLRLAAYIVADRESETPEEEGNQNKTLFNSMQDPKRDQKVVEQGTERIEFKLKQKGLRPIDPAKPGIELERPEFDAELTRAFLERQSFRIFQKEPVPLTRFTRFLACLIQMKLPGIPFPKYRFPSGGGLYPVQTYLYVKPDRVAGLPGGAYYYHPAEHRLIPTGSGKKLGKAFLGFLQKIYDSAGFALFLVARMDAIKPMYGEWSRDLCLLEAGYMGQLLMSVAPQQLIGLCPVGYVPQESVQELFELDGEQILLHSFLGGGIEKSQLQQWLQAEAAHMPVSTEALRNFLREKLPEHMQPAAYMFLDALPLSSNGKVNRRALPALTVVDDEQPATPPRTPIEKKLAEIWAEVLPVKKINIHDNFFELGGNSLTGTQVITRVRETLQVELPVFIMFERATIAKLAERIENTQWAVAEPMADPSDNEMEEGEI